MNKQSRVKRTNESKLLTGQALAETIQHINIQNILIHPFSGFIRE